MSRDMREYWNPRFSPDGNRIAVEINSGGSPNIWIYEIQDGLLKQLTFEGGTVPSWSSDGKQVAFRKDNAIWTVPSDFGGTPTLLPGTDG